ncbi:hypothetical protein EJB05_48952, partial [Eragrostis curvula]
MSHTDVNLLNKENENLRLELALKTTELELEENHRLKLELITKTKENDFLLTHLRHTPPSPASSQLLRQPWVHALLPHPIIRSRCMGMDERNIRRYEPDDLLMPFTSTKQPFSGGK